MKKFLFTTCLIAGFSFLAGAQPVNQASGSVSGKVLDHRTQLPVEYANVVLYQVSDSGLVNGSVTNNEGVFYLNQVPFGDYRLRVSFIGYKDLWIDTVFINPRSRNLQFERILLQESASVLGKVEVTAKQGVMEMHIDKRVFNVDQSIVSQGQTATEVLETVPSVEVDMDGNVSLRGSGNVTILIDGRPSAMLSGDIATALKQIPANIVESIEIITNPSAKYDPEGMSGIVNIKLKKDRRGGINGVVSAGYGTWGKYNGSLNLNYRTQKFNVFGSYSLNRGSMYHFGTTNTVNSQNPDSLFYTDQELNMVGQRRSQMVRVGADWFINKKNTLSGTFSTNLSKHTDDDTVFTVFRDVNRLISDRSNRISGSTEDETGYSAGLTWQRQFGRQGQELLVDANLSVRDETEETSYTDEILYAGYSDVSFYDYSNRRTFDVNRVASLQADYTHPINSRSKIEAGARIGYRMLDDDQYTNNFDTATGLWIPDTNRTYQYIFSEMIPALYATWSGSLSKLSYKAGLRLEHTLIHGDLPEDAEDFSRNYPSLFPSIHLSYKQDKSTEYLISYSRRISRPRSGMLNPFTDYSDPMNIRTGNPYLDPEFTHSIEVGYSRFFKKFSIISSIFYRQSNDQIERFKEIDSTGVTIMTFRNLSSGISYGYEFIGTYHPAKWWSINGNFNLNQRIINADKIQEGLRNSGLMWSVKLMSTMNLSTGTSIQITGNYTSPRILTLGTSAPRYVVDLGVRQSVLKNRGTLSLRVSDVFYTSNWIQSLEGAGFSQEIERYFDSRVAFLTFTWQFGKQQKENGNKKRNVREQGDEGEGGGEMMF
ncbi:MAG TPA: TonB-dependent receptor [Bacteroidales bacterium]|nr:TonB-dependent receptor [Bacteroidales bacterium]HRZ48902.1 TonB-dependent receptor [Bacteroidales bacterium]